MVSLISSAFPYILKSTNIILYLFFIFSVFRQMEWEQFWRNEDRQLAALHQGEKKE